MFKFPFGRRSVKAAVVSMQKDEGLILPAWLSYYKRLVGLKHIYIIDNGSESELMLAALARATARGVKVVYRPGRETFEQKGPVVQELARQLTDYDVVLPLDADEFLGVMEAEAPCYRTRTVRDELRRFTESDLDVGLIRNSFMNVPGTTLVEWKGCRKVIMRPAAKRPLSKGYHFPPKFKNGFETTLCHIHFHKRGSAEDMRRSALLKLPEDVASRDMSNYTDVGHHMKGYLKMSEEEYRARSKSSQGIDIAKLFRSLGHPVPYSTWTPSPAPAT